MHCSATVQLFFVDQPNHRFLALVDFARITTSRVRSYGVRLQKELAQYCIACGRDGHGLVKNVYITDLYKFASEHTARLSQHSVVIMLVGL